MKAVPHLRYVSVLERGRCVVLHRAHEPGVFDLNGLVAAAQDDVKHFGGRVVEAGVIREIGPRKSRRGCKPGRDGHMHLVDQFVIGPSRYVWV